MTEDTASGKYTDPLSLNKYTYCHNQPVTGYDPDGHFLHIVVGAAIGAVVGGAISAYSQYKSTGKVTFKKTIGAAVEGAVVGGVGAATAGASLGVTVADGAAAGAAGNTANQLISTGKVNKKQVAVSAIGGAAGSAGAKLAGAAVNAGSQAAPHIIKKVAGDAGKQAASKFGGTVLGKTIIASAKGGITGASAGASADLAMQIAKDKKHDIRNVNWKEVGGSALLGGGIGAGVGAASQTKFGQKVSASQAEWDKKLNAGIEKFKNGFKSYGQKAFAKSSTGIRYRKGQPVVATEKTLDMALDPETYAYAIAKKYGINLKVSGQKITIRYDQNLNRGTYGKTTAKEPNVIKIGPDALMSETELANTIAHELNHARDYIRGGIAPEDPAYKSGNALSEYINGER